MEAAEEILESWVRNPSVVQRFVSGAAGCGKSYMKKFVVCTARDAGFKVLVLALAALFAQDDEQGEGGTMTSVCNGRLSGPMFDEGCVTLGNADFVSMEEAGMLPMADGKRLTAMAERGMGLKYHHGIGDGGCGGEARANAMCEASTGKGCGDEAWCFMSITFFGDLMQQGAINRRPLYA
jgi:hypothetical protein